MLTPKNWMAEKLRPHIGHNVVCACYGSDESMADICIECEDCGEVLVSAEDFNDLEQCAEGCGHGEHDNGSGKSEAEASTVENGAVIHFNHDGAEYSMTEAEIDAAHRYREHQNRLSDARMHVNIFVYGYDAEEFDSEEEIENRLNFEAEYGISYEAAVSQPMLEKYVLLFDTRYNCDYGENCQWENAIIAAIEESI